MSAAADMPSVGFIGLGAMGFHMAGLLVKAGFPLCAFDTNATTAARFAGCYPTVRLASTLSSFATCDVVVTMLPDSTAVESTVVGASGQPGLLQIIGRGSTVIDMSSSDPLRTKALERSAAEHGIGLLDAPVSGGVRRAKDGTLAIMIGGDKQLVDRYHRLFACLGRNIMHVGPPGSGHAVKALNNYVSAAGLIAVSEALHVAARLGLAPDVVNEVFNKSSARNSATETKVEPFMLSGKFDSGFSLRLMAKDVQTAIGLGESLGQTMVVGRAVRQLCDEAADSMADSADQTEVYRFVEDYGRQHEVKVPQRDNA